LGHAAKSEFCGRERSIRCKKVVRFPPLRVHELLKLAGNDSPLAGLGPDEVGGLDGGLCALEDESRRESYASILGRARREEVTVEAEAPMPLELGHWSMHSHSALFCEVRVNIVTGEIRVSRFLGSFDCGRILNAKTAASQFRGGIIMGLGLAPTEEVMFDERSGADHEPVARRVSRAGASGCARDRRDLDRRAGPSRPRGRAGRGRDRHHRRRRGGANAVFNATGKRVRDLPVTLDKLM
jgi:xanthine dehydrogenase YagR molybdenum-binding subunit